LTVSEFISNWRRSELPGPPSSDVTREATAAFTVLARNLKTRGHEPPTVSRFLIRVLFCLFADAIGLLPERQFTRLIEVTKTKTAAFEERLTSLFAVLSTGGSFGTEDIPHIQGSLFTDAKVLPLNREELAVLWNCTRMDWARIGPSLFGTAFEPALDFGDDGQFGRPYESGDDILLIVTHLDQPCHT
jgi:hypothetical protein